MASSTTRFGLLDARALNRRLNDMNSEHIFETCVQTCSPDFRASGLLGFLREWRLEGHDRVENMSERSIRTRNVSPKLEKRENKENLSQKNHEIRYRAEMRDRLREGIPPARIEDIDVDVQLNSGRTQSFSAKGGHSSAASLNLIYTSDGRVRETAEKLEEFKRVGRRHRNRDSQLNVVSICQQRIPIMLSRYCPEPEGRNSE
ncbi:hypothetical protein OBBRIDRAFT_804192 [Obba rivulosa]|uniref:Uncharacterized protein n=1 Tax=Obba rivulosa TaxID=1052685 RepID=A0A8E2B0T5_9APHY|nr:hypothetical protein OBBRIDRAFT_804192 [Obba rivulosa]